MTQSRKKESKIHGDRKITRVLNHFSDKLSNAVRVSTPMAFAAA